VTERVVEKVDISFSGVNSSDIQFPEPNTGWEKGLEPLPSLVHRERAREMLGILEVN
jgi:hypothetical protein